MGSNIFATVQRAADRDHFPKTCGPEAAGTGDVASPKQPPGAVVVIDVAKAVSDSAHAILAEAAAGCEPVRDALSPDGQTLWVVAPTATGRMAC